LLPHREKYLLLVTGFMSRLLELHRQLVDEVQLQLDDRVAAAPPRATGARARQRAGSRKR
jgi:hypothetical protein